MYHIGGAVMGYMGEEILLDIKKYCEDNLRKIDEAAKKLETEMLEESL